MNAEQRSQSTLATVVQTDEDLQKPSFIHANLASPSAEKGWMGEREECIPAADSSDSAPKKRPKMRNYVTRKTRSPSGNFTSIGSAPLGRSDIDGLLNQRSILDARAAAAVWWW